MKILNMIGVDEFKDCWGMCRRLIAELIGTFLLTVILISGIRERKDTVEFALANGFILASIIAFTGHISGGHVNPAVTVGMFTCNFIKLIPAICYIIAQIVGALLGQMVVKLVQTRGFPMIVRNLSSLKARSAFGLEVLATFLLVSVAASVSDPRRFARGVGSAALAIGLSVAGFLCAETDYRCSMNPAAALAVSVFLNSFEDHWVVWFGPLVGGLLAGLVYRVITTHKRYPRIQVDYDYS